MSEAGIVVTRPMRSTWWAAFLGVDLPLVPELLVVKEWTTVQDAYDAWHCAEEGIESCLVADIQLTRLRLMQRIEFYYLNQNRN